MTYEQQKYIEAKQDILKAAKSINELSQQQQIQLAEEIFGTELVLSMIRIMQPYFK
jgi:hypothetical protein